MAGADPRVRTVVIQNSGLFTGASPIEGMDVPKAQLARLHTPVLYVLGGREDVAWPNGTDDVARMAHVPVALADLPAGHGGTFAQPNGGAVAQVVVDWLTWQLQGDDRARRRFAGAGCGLCRDPAWIYRRKGM